jgi:hypothetical protein
MKMSLALVPFNEARGTPFGQTTGDNPRFRFSTRTFRVTRRMRAERVKQMSLTFSRQRFLDLAHSSFSAINFFAVSDAINSHNRCRIGNLIDNAVVADPNPPIALRAGKFATSDWTRIVRETTQHISRPGSYAERESP